MLTKAEITVIEVFWKLHAGLADRISTEHVSIDDAEAESSIVGDCDGSFGYVFYVMQRRP